MNSSNVKKVLCTFCELILMMILYAILDNIGGIKKYVFVLGISFFYLIIGRKKQWSIESVVCIVMPVVAYIVLGSLSALLSVNAQTSAVKVILFWIVPVFFAFSLYIYYGERMNHIVDVQFLGSCLAYKLFDAPITFGIYTWESVYSFTFGMFGIYYLYKKRWGMFLAAVFFVWLAEKRIGLLAIVIISAIRFFLWLFQENKKLIYTLWGLCIGAIFGYVYLIYSGIMEAFCWGANINTSGRVEMYTKMAQEYEFSPLFLGEGLGIVEKLLEYWRVSVFQNLHYDLLKFYIELCFIGLLLFLLSYGVSFFFIEKRFGKLAMGFAFVTAIYSVLLYATDNVSIYMIYLIPMYSTFFAMLASERNIND